MASQLTGDLAQSMQIAGAFRPLAAYLLRSASPVFSEDPRDYESPLLIGVAGPSAVSSYSREGILHDSSRPASTLCNAALLEYLFGEICLERKDALGVTLSFP